MTLTALDTTTLFAMLLLLLRRPSLLGTSSSRNTDGMSNYAPKPWRTAATAASMTNGRDATTFPLTTTTTTMFLVGHVLGASNKKKKKKKKKKATAACRNPTLGPDSTWVGGCASGCVMLLTPQRANRRGGGPPSVQHSIKQQQQKRETSSNGQPASHSHKWILALHGLAALGHGSGAVLLATPTWSPPMKEAMHACMHACVLAYVVPQQLNGRALTRIAALPQIPVRASCRCRCWI
ncbi:uncharacterized protein IWZ02DRAFT_190692 [Phyllosticta citriasiana]|uniref:uncharacterized protein n=1 Tax=Phyllosticta citriasiana TaxID=595635 RepID=UPI0030FD88AD